MRRRDPYRSIVRAVVVTAMVISIIIGFVYVAARYGPAELKPPQITAPWGTRLEVPGIIFTHDQDGDGLDDLRDFVQGAKDEVKRAPRYRSDYYDGGYPPPSEGVCTDLIWRAFRDAGYDLKSMVDLDIQANLGLYWRVEGSPEPNIDFRRVPNLDVFFKRHAQVLTTEVIPGDAENLQQWQPGDIVVWDRPIEHIGIISDRRRQDGVPYVLHNAGPVASEADILLTWRSKLIGHYRFPKVE